MNENAIDEKKVAANREARAFMRTTQASDIEERLTIYIYSVSSELSQQKQRISELELALTLAGEAVRTGQYYKVAGIVRKALEGSDIAFGADTAFGGEMTITLSPHIWKSFVSSSNMGSDIESILFIGPNGLRLTLQVLEGSNE